MHGGDTEEVATSVAALRAAGATVVDDPLVDVRDEALEITRRYWNRAQLDGRCERAAAVGLGPLPTPDAAVPGTDRRAARSRDHRARAAVARVDRHRLRVATPVEPHRLPRDRAPRRAPRRSPRRGPGRRPRVGTTTSCSRSRSASSRASTLPTDGSVVPAHRCVTLPAVGGVSARGGGRSSGDRRGRGRRGGRRSLRTRRARRRRPIPTRSPGSTTDPPTVYVFDAR